MADLQPKDLNEQISLNDSDILLLQNGLTNEVMKTAVSTVSAYANRKEEYQEIGRTTLASAADTITVNGLSAYTYLKIVAFIDNTNAVDILLRFNNDSGVSYAGRYASGGATDTTYTGGGAIILMTSESTDQFTVVEVVNVATKEKLVLGQTVTFGASGVSSAPSKLEVAGKWANTSSSISRVDIVNDQTGDFAAGSTVIVYGHN